ncbi:MAG: hypothetical protein AAGE65_00550, partial [Planctomycetota bacterium]
MPRAAAQRESLVPRLAAAAALALVIHLVSLPVAVGWVGAGERDDPTESPLTPTADPFDPAADLEPEPDQPTGTSSPAADLAIREPQAPTRLILGSKTPLRFTVANLGQADAVVRDDAAAPWWTDAAFLSADATLDPGDALIARADALPRLSRGSDYDATLDAVIPEDAPTGSMFLLLVTDADDAVDEAGREANNVRPVAVEVRPVAQTPDDPVLGDDAEAPRITVAWISHEAFEELQAGPRPSETIQPALQRDATPVPDAPLRAGNPAPSGPGSAAGWGPGCRRGAGRRARVWRRAGGP